MGIASSRGSFRIAYKATKILSVNTGTTVDGTVNTLTIRTTANREKGAFNAMLKVDGVRIMGGQNG